MWPKKNVARERLLTPHEEKRRKTKKIVLFFVAAVLIVLIGFGLKAGSILNKISDEASIFESLVKSLPGVADRLKGEEEGRINILLLGMRGENVPGGGLLADTIMVLSIHPKSGEEDRSRASLISIPRDLYVQVPNRNEQRKVNAVYALGEERERGGGMKDMQAIIGQVTGETMHYTVTINFKGFIDLVNALGGITVTLNAPFTEPLQFHEPQVCDPYVYTVPTKPPQYQHKYHTRKNGTRYIAKSYPLCYNRSEECGGNFSLPVGENTLDGTKALCYARSRATSNDFERARRQQQVIQEIKEKALSIGTLSDFGKVNAILNSLGNNAKTNMEAWEMKRLFELYQETGDVPLNQKVLEDSEAGLLYAPEANDQTGYILLPRGNSYEQIHALFDRSLEY